MVDSFISLFDPSSYDKQVISVDENRLPPEPQTGNVEYKLKLINPSKHRFEHLVTQMKWRLREGHGQAIYKIGVEDNGSLVGLSFGDLKNSLQTLGQMALKIGATIKVIKEQQLENGQNIAEVLIRKLVDDCNNSEIRIAVVGNADVGKSTLLGVLTHGNLDNGRGKARLNMFRHLHEVRTGRTSSISHEIIGFDADGQTINYSYSELITPEEICESSTRLVKFLDLAGHKKYFKTTIKGLSGYCPHYAMLVISSTITEVGMAQEHLSIAVALNIPFFIVITKIDLLPPSRILQNLNCFLKIFGSQKIPLIVRETSDFHSNIKEVVPIFCISSVTGEGLELLLKFLYILPYDMTTVKQKYMQQQSLEFQIDETFQVGDIGQILGGLLLKGIISEGLEIQIGPHQDGSFTKAAVKSIHTNRMPCRRIYAGQTATICLDTTVPDLRSGMVMLSSKREARGCFYFQANICITFHATAICKGFQTTLFIGNVCQAAVIVGIFSSECLRTNEKDSVLFRFMKRPEFVCVGQKLLFREGNTKGIGEVTQIFPCKEELSFMCKSTVSM